MRGAALFFASTLCVAACLPDFELEHVRFPSDAEARDADLHDADPHDADPHDADPRDADPPELNDAGPADLGDGGVPREICGDGVDNDRDTFTDCVDLDDCGLDACNDQNDCTDESCLDPSGMCLRSYNTREENGWRCENGNKHETLCVLTSDDEDEDGNANCRDVDCCEDLACVGMTCP